MQKNPSQPMKLFPTQPMSEKRPFPSATLTQQFSQQASATPQKVAVTAVDGQLTFAQLEAKSNQLAHYLRQFDIQPDTLIGIALPRQTDLLVAILGILKAGAAYLPIDPAYPAQRIQYKLNHAQVPLLITNSLLASQLPTHQAQTILIDQDWPQIATHPTANIDHSALENLAYVIYTSGSTGQPKGVQITQHNLANFLGSMQEKPGITTDDNLLAVTTLSFDIATLELYLPIISGAHVLLADQTTTKDASLLLEWLDNNSVTMMQATPATWQMLLAAGWQGKAGLTILSGGEALSTDLARQLLQCGTAVYNMYGPTETTVWSTCLQVEETHCQTDGFVAIGDPIANTTIHILDDQRNPVSVGEVGNLYIGGAGVARGYLHQPKLTAERFITHPSQPDERIYLTGDLARYTENGRLEFLGRSDHQVKILGFRIELGEIENHLLQHEDVAQAVVHPQQVQGAANAHLVAYLISNKETTLNGTMLRTHLQQTLPDYMIPHHFVFLDNFPLTPNGKVDRNALPMPAPIYHTHIQAENAPSSPTEASLITLCQMVLEIEGIHRDDNFIELGGDSLQATRLITKIKKRFGVRLRLTEVFGDQTIAQVAQLITDKQSKATSSHDHLSAIPKADSSRPIPVSFAQQRLLILDQLAPNEATYNIPYALRINGSLDTTLLQNAVNTLFVRHSSLRTSFSTDAHDQPIQQISRATHLPIQHIDLSQLAIDAAEKEADKQIQAEAERPFSLTNDTLIRVIHLQLNDENHRLLIIMHHTISDGWSMERYIQELIHLYKCALENKAEQLPKLPIQYSDYATWQHKYWQGKQAEDQLAYWQKQLSDAPAIINLPIDLPRPKIKSSNGAEFSATLSPSLIAQLEALSKAHNSTLFMTLMTAFNTLLARYSQQEDIVVGTPIVNRNHPDTENIIGFFANTLPLRTKLSPAASFSTLIQQVKQNTLDAYEHQEIPFEQIVDALQLTRDTSYSPVFQVTFALENALSLPEQPINSTFELIPVAYNFPKFDLMLTATHTKQGLRCAWSYNTDLFLPDRINRMHTHFIALLQAIIQNPNAPLSMLPILTPAEKQLFFEEWQGKIDNTIPDLCLHQQVEAWAKTQPSATAVSDENSTLTYHQLNSRANQLARHFIQHGVQSGDLVGIHMPASVPAIITIFACYKIGAAYVPFDPSYPAQRLQFMLEDTAAPVIVTDSTVAHLDTHNCTILSWQEIQVALASHDDSNLNRDISPQSPAYVIYTSGSTGKPKGVICAHKGVFNLAKGINDIYTLTPQTRTSLWTSLNFDASVIEFFPAFINGGSVHVVPQAIRTDAEQLFAWMAEHTIDNSYLPPFFVEPFLKWLQASHENKSYLRRLKVAVEPLAEQMLTTIKAELPKITIINGYGPTESTVCVTMYEVPANSTRTTHAPIGRAQCNIQIYLLDKQMKPVPIGVPGELYIGGMGLAQGYLNRPALTAESFIPNPFSDEPGARLYRTGDLAHYLPDGNILFNGRSDYQLKIRGFRVELGEIEAALRAQPTITAAVVKPYTPPEGQTILVAYFVTETGSQQNQDSLREALLDELPNYMVPSIWMQLEAMPRTPNDKIDRKALPTPNLEMLQRTTDFVAPRNAVETKLATIWHTLLKIKKISVHDDFFVLGGNSLLITQLVSHIQNQFNIRIPLSQAFEQSTIAQLAHIIINHPTTNANQSNDELKPDRTDFSQHQALIEPANPEERGQLSLAQKRLWFFYKLDPNSVTYNVPTALRLQGEVNPAWLQQSLTNVVQRHEVLRSTFYETDDVYTRVQEVTQLPLPVVDLQHLTKEEQEKESRKRIDAESKRPFTLTTDLPIRAQLLQLHSDHFILLLTFHHIATDIWSVELLINEVTNLYQAYRQGEGPSLSPLPIQYSDYAVWQNKWLTKYQDAQIQYWQNRLSGSGEQKQLPADKQLTKPASSKGAPYTFQLPQSLNEQSHQLMQEEKATLFMLLLATYQALLHQYSGQSEINIGVPFANRHHINTEQLIGFFVNTIVLNATISPDMTFRDLLQQMRVRVLEAQDHQDLPFNKVVEVMAGNQKQNRSSLFQSFFTVQTVTESPEIADVVIEPIANETESAKFDLALVFSERDGQLVGNIEYKTDLFSANRIAQICQHFVTLFAQILRNPNIQLHALDVRTPAEKEKQMQAAQSRAVAQSFPEKWTEVVTQFAQQTAVSSPDYTLTYQQLDEQSNQIAHLLQKKRVRKGDIVAIHATESPQMITAVLGVLKAGAYYLPLNANEPDKWQKYCLRQGKPKLLLHSKATKVTHLNRYTPVAIETAANLPITPLATLDGGGLYLPHFGSFSIHELSQLAAVYPLQAGTNSLQFASFASHQATHELWATLLNGGTLHLASQSTLTKLSAITALLKEQQINFAILPAVLLTALDPQRLPHLHTAVSLEADIPATIWQKWAGKTRLQGHLSPTTILPTVLQNVDAMDEQGLRGTPIQPIKIINKQGQPAPTGVVGELEVITNQSSALSASPQLINTKDQWCWLENGRIQFHGYHPTHTTTRGRYLDTTIIAKALKQYPVIRDCVVLPEQKPCDKRQLHAYVVLNQQIDSSKLTEIAQQHLPSQLIPVQFHVLDNIPQNNETINFKVLEAMQQPEPTTTEEKDARSDKQSELSNRKQNLSAKKQALLAKWQQKKKSSATKIEHIPQRQSNKDIPLSFAQQRLWFLEQLNDQADASYNVPIHLDIDGSLNLEALEYSLNQLLQRYEIFHTRYLVGADEKPHQIIDPFTAVSLPITDLSHLPPAEKEAQARLYRDQNGQQPFDLETGPVYRTHILRLDENKHQLLFTIHHIAFDAWSTDLFLREIIAHYLHKTVGITPNLPPETVQYADYTLWQQKRLTPDTLDKQLTFWRDHLADAPEKIDLPTDAPYPSWQTTNGDIHEFSLSSTIKDKVKEWSQTEQITVFVTLLTAFYGLLYRYTNQEDIVVGTPIANRNHPDLKNAMGFFLNTLALRSHIDDTTTWQALLQQTQQTMLSAHAHQEYPFENLVHALSPKRDNHHHPLFQVMFLLQNQALTEQMPAQLPLKMRQILENTRTAKFDLTLNLQETNEGFAASFEYNTDIFFPETIARMAQHFQQIVTAMVMHPEQHIAQANLLTPAEQMQIDRWNDTAVSIDNTQLVHHRFEAQAAATPDAIAVQLGEQALTYAELDSRANQLAHFLRTEGVQTGSLVGVSLPRSLEMITAVLAILKAGAGYVPLDPNYPDDRLQSMIQQAEIKLLLTHSTLTIANDTIPTINLDTVDIDSQATTPLDIAADPEQPVYVIFTSGSTGQPKGVVLPHRALNNLLAWQQSATQLQRPARTLQFTSLNFDVHFQEIFSTWQDGGILVLISDDVRRDSEQLLAYLQTYQIERLFLPFVALQNLAETAQITETYPDSLQEVITAGEALQATPAIREFFTKLPNCVLHNQYGPSETHVVTQYTLSNNPSEWQDLPPIGQPIANTQIYILDSSLQPVPIGIPGELYLAGTNLAQGYINQPELTAERFVANPFSDNPQQRLYKTGDFARYLPDGNIQYIGRVDFQLKIRGHRIELAEIEATLNRYPSVQQAVVQAYQPDHGGHHLIAYIKTNNGDDQADLHAYLQTQLPNYMIPTHYVQLEAFPLTNSGKINRRALPLPEKSDFVRTTPFVPAETVLEKQLIEIWESLLHVSPIGIHDNFMELGGHSLLATQLVSRIRKKYNVQLPLRVIFTHGTVAQLAQQITNAQVAVDFPTISKADSNALFPVSFAQQRLLIIDQLAGDQASYNIPLLFQLNGRLDTIALQNAVDALFERHAALRTSFIANEDEQLYQQISAETHLPIQKIDFSDLSAEEQTAQVRHWIEAEVKRPFSLMEDTLIRVNLIQLAPEKQLISIVLHHIIADGWSLSILFQEIAELYAAFVEKRPSSLPELPIQYVDFATWQREWLQGIVLQEQLDYWVSSLQNAPAVLNLPTDRPRPMVQSDQGAVFTSQIPTAWQKNLQQLAQEEKATLFMTLLATYQLLLARYSQQDDIVVGSPIANRNRTEIEGLIGLFINMLALRTDLSGNPTFRELLNRVRETTFGAYTHQDMPFEKLVEELHPNRDMSHAPIFQVAFILQNTPNAQVSMPGLTVAPIDAPLATAKYDITLVVTETTDGLDVAWEYSTALFDQETIVRLDAHFKQLLQQIMAQPDLPIGQLDLLTAAEKAQLAQWNDSKRPFPNKPIHELISEQAKRTPDCIAVRDQQSALTYQQLEAQSNQLAHHLQTLGVQPDTFVAVMLNRSAQMMVGLLGILKAGGAYIPIDPAFPAQRIQFMLSDAQAPLILTETSLVASLPAHNAQLLHLDTILDEIADLPTTLPETAVTHDHLAYIIYTSGSTGRPKGVQIRHGSFTNLLTDMQEKPGMCAEDKLLAITTLSFDIATVELYLPLLVGAQTFVAPQSALTDPQQLIALLEKEAITYMQATPATWQMLLTANWQGQPGLQMITGGEALSVALAQQLLARGAKLWNMYAPSETTTYSTIYPVLLEELTPDYAIPIGRPVANTQLYILDDQLKQVPVGVIGNLYIGGEGVARGYLNQPELTDERFIPNPLNDEKSDRLYNTGDLASFRADGAVNFWGRSDHQVKIRGFRIELGEIESCLQQHADIAQAVVHAHGQQLVAYFIYENETDRETAVSTTDLRTHLKQTLPSYMVPHIFMPLNSFPLTPNGKVDRKALPAPKGERDDAVTSVAPRTATEAKLVAIWKSLLNIEEVSVHDNFFELGGHSLLATQLVSRIQKQFEVKLPLRAVFDQSTVAQLALLIDQSQAKATIPTIPVADKSQPLPVSFAQQRLLIIDHLAPNQATYNIPLALRINGRLDTIALQTAVNQLFQRHDALRTTFAPRKNGQFEQHIAEDTELPIRKIDFSDLPQDEREAKATSWVQAEAERPFSLTQDTLIRVAVVTLAPAEHVLVIVMHHIITDGWSMNIVVRELLHLYNTTVTQQPSQLPELRIQYSDFAAWQREWLQGDVLNEQLAYWQETLADAPPLLTLPTDHPRPRLQSTNGTTYEQSLPNTLTQSLRSLSQKESSTLFMTLFTAYNILLARHSQQEDLVIGTPVANRNHPDVENIIGFFVNMLPLRTKIGADDSFSTLLAQVRQSALDAYKHQDIPFETLVDQLQPERDTSHSPIFQVAFTLQNQDGQLPQPNDVTIAPLTTEGKTAKYDLTLFVTETPNGLACSWEYNTDLFLPATIARLHDQFATLLQAIIDNPQQQIARLTLLPEAQMDLLLHQWQGKTDNSVPTHCLHEQIEVWAQEQPTATAVSDATTTLSYQQLNGRGNQLARLLISKGVQPRNAVGIHMPNNVTSMITILACHKARAAYVPFDPAYPDQRLQFMLEDTAVPVIITDTNLDALTTENCTILRWAEIQIELDQLDASNLQLSYQPTDPAYIIYTSGSTGTPKGVVCGHTSVFNLLQSFDQFGTLPAQANGALWTSLNFDVSVYEIFSTLLAGGHLHIVPQKIRTHTQQLFNWLNQHNIQSCYLPPFLVEPFAQWLPENAESSLLERLLVGVEPLAEQSLVAIQNAVPTLKVINGYGPSEATVCATLYPIPGDSTRNGNAPIGKPLLNSQLYLLDAHCQPVPVGVTGEIYIGGMGLAHGYLNRPELTAERFISNPFSADPTARLYKTGDLARALPDGNIQFIGRTDNQLKIRGFRIELGEIETELLAQEGVTAVSVIPHTIANEQKILVAYYVLAAESTQSEQSLRQALFQTLPNHMVPTVWMQLDAMPRTPNDKIDRKALPTPSLEEGNAINYVAPTNPLETELIAIWQNVLRKEPIGIHDNFFALGGHSLLALELINEVHATLNVTIPMQHLFQEGTVAAMAQFVVDASQDEDLDGAPAAGDDERQEAQAELDTRRQNLSSKKQALLAKWQQKNGKVHQQVDHIPQRSTDDPIPLSFAQQRLWFIEQITSESDFSYNIPIHFTIEGDLDVDALTYSFNQLLQRHESLRTRFVQDDTQTPYQEIDPFTAVSLPITDLTHLTATEKEAKAKQLRQQAYTTPFNLQTGSIYRIQLLRLDAKHHQLLFTIHHIAFDAWSTDLFLREIIAHYLHKTMGFAPQLPEATVQYADFTLWQQKRLTAEEMAKQLAFWREHLADTSFTLELPTDRPRPPIQTSNGSAFEFNIPAEIADNVKAWTQQEHATLFMTMFAAFNGLLHHYSKQEKIIVGTPIANRNHPDLKNMIGFFLNTLALNTQIEETTTWQSLLQQTRQTMLAAQTHQEFPFENLVQALLPERDPSRHPLFQVMFVLHNQSETTQQAGTMPIQLSPIEVKTEAAKFDLLLTVEAQEDGFVAGFEYNTDLFDESTIERMAGHYQQIVETMISAPTQLVSQATLLTDAEKQEIDHWNDTAVSIDSNELLHHRFERQASQTPHAIAVEFGDQKLTYAQLDAQANQLAHFLQSKGIQPDKLVGILLSRSVEMITAVLGILKAGAGYVPLDPNYPAERLQLMMDQAEVDLILTHSNLQTEEIATPQVALDHLDLTTFETNPVTAVIPPTQPVYVIFTSGSTGTPKGVVLPHRALNNLMAWQQQATHLQKPGRTLQFTSLSFDVHCQEIFTTLQEGGTLVLIPDDVRRDGEQLLAYIQTHQIERLLLPFVALHNLAEAAAWQKSYPTSLKEVITAGEALQSTPAIRQFFTELPNCVLHNQYGPSETHVVTQYTLGDAPSQWPDLPSIGQPVANTQIHILNANMQPVPIGIVGEMYLGGHNLAHGYINQPELTAERFIANPFSTDPNAKLYKTGDLVRYLPDGNIQFLGRNDFQVKIRGHRIELGEIEAVLNEHTAVQQAVVIAHKPTSGAHQLIAYIKTDQDDVAVNLATHLHHHLPSYMIPAHCIRIEQFPLTASGKIDRLSLPVPEKLEIVRNTEITAAETELQQQLIDVWEDVLNVSPIGIHDNFFELGGHSLLALRLVAAMHKATGIKLPLPRLFQDGTIAAIASYMSNPDAQAEHSPVVPLRVGDPNLPPLILIHPGSGQVLPYLQLVQALPDQQPIYGLQSLGLLPNTAAQTEIDAMATAYLQALADAQIPQPYHLTGWSMGGMVALAMAQELRHNGTPPASLTLIDTFAPESDSDVPKDTVLLQWFAQDAGYLAPKAKPTLLPDEVGVDAQLKHLWKQLQATGNLPTALTLEDVQKQFTVFRKNYAAMRHYRPQIYPLPVQLIAAKASTKSIKDKQLGWKRILTQLKVHQLRANHFTLLQEQKHIKRIAKEIGKQLETLSNVKGR